jgi:ankyrin repeat protein
VDVATPERVQPLHMAAQFAHVEAAAALVAAGADLAAVNTDGLGVLHAAAIGGSVRLVDALLAAGVRPSSRTVRK